MKKPKLFLLHFAGGNCYSFQFMEPLLKDFDVFSLELPGRGRRINEGLLKDFDSAAQDIYRQIANKLANSNFLIYGHSMGAYLALRVSGILEKEGRLPACLVVSGNAGSEVGDDKKRSLYGNKEFIEELQSIGGIPPELLEDKELFSFFEPILRADFEIVEGYKIANEAALSSPIYALMGSREEDADKISNWSRFTRSRFNFEILEGDHFFIRQHPQRIAMVIKDCYDKSFLFPR